MLLFHKFRKKSYMIFVTGAAYDKKQITEVYMDMTKKDGIFTRTGIKNNLNPLFFWSLFPSNPSDLQVLNLANYYFRKNYLISNVFTGKPYYNLYFIDSISLSIKEEFEKEINNKFKNYSKLLRNALNYKCKRNENYVDYISLSDLEKANDKEVCINIIEQQNNKIKFNIKPLDINGTVDIRSESLLNQNKEYEKKEKVKELVEKIPLQPYGGILSLSYLMYIMHNKIKNRKIRVFIPNEPNNDNIEYYELVRFIFELASDPQEFEIVSQDSDDWDIKFVSIKVLGVEHLLTKGKNLTEIPINQMLALPYPSKEQKYFPLPYDTFCLLSKNPYGINYLFFVGGAEHNYAMVYFFNYLKWRTEISGSSIPGIGENWFDLLKKIQCPLSKEIPFINSTGGFVKTINGMIHKRGHDSWDSLISINNIKTKVYNKKVNALVYRVYGISAPMTRISLYHVLNSIKNKCNQNPSEFIYAIKTSENQKRVFLQALEEWDEKDAFNNITPKKVKDVQNLLNKYFERIDIRRLSNE